MTTSIDHLTCPGHYMFWSSGLWQNLAYFSGGKINLDRLIVTGGHFYHKETLLQLYNGERAGPVSAAWSSVFSSHFIKTETLLKLRKDKPNLSSRSPAEPCGLADPKNCPHHFPSPRSKLSQSKSGLISHILQASRTGHQQAESGWL